MVRPPAGLLSAGKHCRAGSPEGLTAHGLSPVSSREHLLSAPGGLLTPPLGAGRELGARILGDKFPFPQGSSAVTSLPSQEKSFNQNVRGALSPPQLHP